VKAHKIGVFVFFLAVALFSFKVKTEVRRAEALASFQGTLPLRGEAPDFSLTDLDGVTVQLTEQTVQNQIVLVNFWATWCAPCRLELPQFETLYEKHREEGLQILAVNVGETEDEVREYLAEHPVSFPVLFDPNNVVATRYRVDAFPTTVILDAQGQVQDVVEGLDPYLIYRVEGLLGREEP
jgi:peroxiredoxin